MDDRTSEAVMDHQPPDSRRQAKEAHVPTRQIEDAQAH